MSGIGWPQVVILVWMVIEIGYAMGRHGQPAGLRHDAIVSVLVQGTLFGLLYMGGFFTGGVR